MRPLEREQPVRPGRGEDASVVEDCARVRVDLEIHFHRPLLDRRADLWLESVLFQSIALSGNSRRGDTVGDDLLQINAGPKCDIAQNWPVDPCVPSGKLPPGS